MFKRCAFVAALFACATLLPSYGAALLAPTAQAAVVAQASLPPLFDTESAAQAHCPKDVVVWLNIPSGIYHYKGERIRAHEARRLCLRKGGNQSGRSRES